MSKRNKIICLIIVILFVVTGFFVYMINYSEQKIQKQYDQIIKESHETTQHLPELLKEYNKYKQ